MKVAWVKYACGCCEGLWVDIESKCRTHNEPVINTSDEINLLPPWKDEDERQIGSS